MWHKEKIYSLRKMRSWWKNKNSSIPNNDVAAAQVFFIQFLGNKFNNRWFNDFKSLRGWKWTFTQKLQLQFQYLKYVDNDLNLQKRC